MRVQSSAIACHSPGHSSEQIESARQTRLPPPRFARRSAISAGDDDDRRFPARPAQGHADARGQKGGVASAGDLERRP